MPEIEDKLKEIMALVFEVSNDDNDNQALIDSYDKKDQLFYEVNWEDTNLFTEGGKKIEAAYV